MCTRDMFDKYSSATKCVGPGVRPVNFAQSSSVMAGGQMQFEQFEKCMRALGVCNGESYRGYSTAQQTRMGAADRLSKPIGQDGRYRLYDLVIQFLFLVV